jgi:hypothetical protein
MLFRIGFVLFELDSCYAAPILARNLRASFGRELAGSHFGRPAGRRAVDGSRRFRVEAAFSQLKSSRAQNGPACPFKLGRHPSATVLSRIVCKVHLFLSSPFYAYRIICHPAHQRGIRHLVPGSRTPQTPLAGEWKFKLLSREPVVRDLHDSDERRRSGDKSSETVALLSS